MLLGNAMASGKAFNKDIAIGPNEVVNKIKTNIIDKKGIRKLF